MRDGVGISVNLHLHDLGSVLPRAVILAVTHTHAVETHGVTRLEGAAIRVSIGVQVAYLAARLGWSSLSGTATVASRCGLVSTTTTPSIAATSTTATTTPGSTTSALASSRSSTTPGVAYYRSSSIHSSRVIRWSSRSGLNSVCTRLNTLATVTTTATWVVVGLGSVASGLSSRRRACTGTSALALLANEVKLGLLVGEGQDAVTVLIERTAVARLLNAFDRTSMLQFLQELLTRATGQHTLKHTQQVRIIVHDILLALECVPLMCDNGLKSSEERRRRLLRQHFHIHQTANLRFE